METQGKRYVPPKVKKIHLLIGDFTISHSLVVRLVVITM